MIRNTKTLDNKLQGLKMAQEQFEWISTSIRELNRDLLRSPISFTWDIWDNINWILENEGEDCSLKHFANMLADVIGNEAIAQADELNQLTDNLEYEIRTYSYAVIVPIEPDRAGVALNRPSDEPVNSDQLRQMIAGFRSKIS